MRNSAHHLRLLCLGAIVPALLLVRVPLAGAVVPATQPAATQPAAPDSPEVKAVRDQLLKWDADVATMSLADFRKTFHTENDREAQYTDFLAHEDWEFAKTEQAVRDKWGADADAQFCRVMGGSTDREDDQICHIKVNGDHAVATWDIKDMKPEKFIKVDGQWLEDVHAMWDDWLADDPNMEINRRPLGKLMQQMRADLADGKYDDADAFNKDLQTRLNQEGN